MDEFITEADEDIGELEGDEELIEEDEEDVLGKA